MKKGKIKIGIDLDGVIVGKPFFVPKSLLEWFFRAHHNHGRKYRIPKLKAEIWLRKISHFWLFRPPLKKNLEVIKKIAQKGEAEIHIVSGRYDFLKEETKNWFEKNQLKNFLKNTYINKDNIQPHLFKEKIAKKMKLDYFFDDDPIVVRHLRKKIKKLGCFSIRKDGDLSIAETKIKN